MCAFGSDMRGSYSSRRAYARRVGGRADERNIVVLSPLLLIPMSSNAIVSRRSLSYIVLEAYSFRSGESYQFSTQAYGVQKRRSIVSVKHCCRQGATSSYLVSGELLCTAKPTYCVKTVMRGVIANAVKEGKQC